MATTATPQTISTAPLEHVAMDFAFLRQEGIHYLEQTCRATVDGLQHP